MHACIGAYRRVRRLLAPGIDSNIESAINSTFFCITTNKVMYFHVIMYFFEE